MKSQRGTQFRIWANSVLKRYLTQKGFAIKENATQIQLQNLSSMLKYCQNLLRMNLFQ